MDRKMYRLLGFVALLIFLGLALWGLYEARKELDKITKGATRLYYRYSEVRILKKGTEIYLSTLLDVYYLSIMWMKRWKYLLTQPLKNSGLLLVC